MARYIDADALKKRISLAGVVPDNMYGMGINRGLDRAETEIDMLPTADVVEVVRCKDCCFSAKHHTSDGWKICTNGQWNTEYYPLVCDNDFCSYGRRKDEISKATDS